MPELEFGKEVTMVGFSVRGNLNEDAARKFAIECVETMGMKCSHPAVVIVYPLHEGKDIGFMLLQPLIESYVILDVWTNHGGFYLGAVSCKDFDSLSVEKLIAKWGFKQVSILGGYLNL